MSNYITQCECTYCGYKWDPDKTTRVISGWRVPSADQCPKCRSKDIEKKKYEKVDYYEEKK